MEPLDLTDRYGTKRNSVMPIAFLSALLAILGVGWLIWSASYHSKPAIRTEVISYDAVSNQIIELKFQISRKDPNQVFICTLTGSDINHFIVVDFVSTVSNSRCT